MVSYLSPPFFCEPSNELFILFLVFYNSKISICFFFISSKFLLRHIFTLVLSMLITAY